MRPVFIAAKGKGILGAIKRAGVIGHRYGFTSGKMNRMMFRFREILQEYEGRATFPIVAVTLARGNGFIEKHQAEWIEFTPHSYAHIDHTRLSREEQLVYFSLAQRLFEARGVQCAGIRCPYLRSNEDTIAAIRQSGFLYDSNQSIAWDVIPQQDTDAYRRLLRFCGAISAKIYPSLPRYDNGLVHIPYCLPDDEALVERLQLNSTRLMSEPWLAILKETYRLGELFTLGLHPERIFLCETALIETLREAHEFSPGIWIARLDEIARWWKTHSERTVVITPAGPGEFELSFTGAQGTTLLARGVDVMTPTAAWDGNYFQAIGSHMRFRSILRPFIGISPLSAPYLKSFLCQQGYIVEQAENGQSHTFFIDRPKFCYEDERPLLAQIEQEGFPLVRFCRWPNGARSALSITGDIDALTIWDYTLRLLGK